jgi:hypothetical protein
MSKTDKKKTKLQERINQLETELRTALHKKTAGPAIDVPKYTKEIQALKGQLAAMC